MKLSKLCQKILDTMMAKGYYLEYAPPHVCQMLKSDRSAAGLCSPNAAQKLIDSDYVEEVEGWGGFYKAVKKA